MSRPSARRFGDRGPVLLRTISGPSGAETLPSGTTVAFRFQRIDGLGLDDGDPISIAGEVVSEDAAAPDPDAGVVRLAWENGYAPLESNEDPEETVSYRLTTEVTYPDGRRVTTPTRGHDYYMVRRRGP